MAGRNPPARLLALSSATTLERRRLRDATALPLTDVTEAIMRCFLMIKGHIAAVEYLRGSDEKMIGRATLPRPPSTSMASKYGTAPVASMAGPESAEPKSG